MNRRDFIKISAVSGAVVAGAAACGRLRPSVGTKVQETRLLMGTIINMTVLAPNQARGKLAIERTFAEMERLVLMFDHRRSDGPLGRLNRDGTLESAPAELRAVLARALAYGEATKGAFDITVKPVVDAWEQGLDPTAKVPLVDYRKVSMLGGSVILETPGMQLTLDGIAKGNVVDGAVAVLRGSGYQRVLVEAGGDLRGSGATQSWRVAIDHPRKDIGEDYVAVFELQQAAAATSGDYMRTFSPDHSNHHIIDPRSGRSPVHLACTTVLAPTATDADALSTALMVPGVEDGLALAERLTGVEALLVGKDLSVHRTSGFPAGI